VVVDGRATKQEDEGFTLNPLTSPHKGEHTKKETSPTPFFTKLKKDQPKEKTVDLQLCPEGGEGQRECWGEGGGLSVDKRNFN
jgi:hypothetical protein